MQGATQTDTPSAMIFTGLRMLALGIHQLPRAVVSEAKKSRTRSNGKPGVIGDGSRVRQPNEVWMLRCLVEKFLKTGVHEASWVDGVDKNARLIGTELIGEWVVFYYDRAVPAPLWFTDLVREAPR